MSNPEIIQNGLGKVGLFVTCLVDFMRPCVGWAAIRLLEDAGCTVDVPIAQTCCGQPAWNSGDRLNAQAVARDVIELFEQYSYVVVPSGSCAATIVKDYPQMFADDPNWLQRAQSLSEKTHELTSFLTDVLNLKYVGVRYTGEITYHDSCSGLRSLGIKEQPRELLASVEGTRLIEMDDAEVCCGFGGTFCVNYSDISDAMVKKKTDNIRATGAKLLLAGDLGCLLNLQGKLAREGTHIEVRHVAEFLAGMLDTPGIGDKA